IVVKSGSWTNLNSLNYLGTLRNNGGATATHALLPGSNAINGGDPVFGCTDQSGNTIPFDQRGYARAIGVCDIGAFEFDPGRIFFNGFD
ncbi:MAG: choice-of-anchor Q domain-containing protein, partial [Rudaea sp.]